MDESTGTRAHEVSVSELPRLVGHDVLAMVMSGAPDSTVRGVNVYDSTSRSQISSQIVLLIGAGYDRVAELVSAMVDIAGRGGVGVVIENPVPSAASAEVLQLTTDLRISVLVRKPGVSWLALADTVREVVRIEGDIDDIAGGVPIGDLPALAESLAEMLGGPVIIEDAKFRVLAYSSSISRVDRGRDVAILGRRIPEEWLKHLESIGATETLLNSDSVIAVENGPFQARRRLLCAIRADRFLLGVLWVAEGQQPLREDVAQKLSLAARAAAPHLLRHQEETFGQRSAQQKTLRRLLETGQVSRSAAEELGIAPAVGYVLVALRCSVNVTLTSVDRNRLLEVIALYCQSYRWSAATTAVGLTSYCLVALNTDHPADRIDALAAALAENGSRALLGRAVFGSISDQAETLHNVPELRSQVDRVLETMDETDSRVTRYADAVPRIVLSNIRDAVDFEKVSFYKIDRLGDHDRDNGTDLVETLRSYLEGFGNVARAAAELGVHVTTLRYRLKKITVISGMNLDDPAERLLCQLLLQPNR